MTGAQDEPDWDALRDAELARHVESMREQGFTGPLPPTSSSSATSARTNGAGFTRIASETTASMRQKRSLEVSASTGCPTTCPTGNGGYRKPSTDASSCTRFIRDIANHYHRRRSG